MLWLTEIARPSVHLRDHFVYYVIPPETVRAFEEEGLVTDKQFRPSKRTKLLAYERQLSPHGIDTVRSLTNGGMSANDIKGSTLSDQERRFALEASAELVEYNYIEGKISKEAYAERYHSLLTQRAALGVGQELLIPYKSNPDTAHHAARVEIAQGWYENRSLLLIGWRPAFHDLSEDDTGHLSGAQIEFLDTLIGVDRDKVSLEKLTILSLASISPVSHFFKPFSWRMKSGWDRDYGNDQLSFVTRVGAGAAIGDEKLFGYLLSEPEMRLGFNADVGIGFSAGAGLNWGNRMKSRIEGGHIVYLDGADRSHIMISHLWEYHSWGALSFNYEMIEQNHHEDRYKIGVNLYF